MFFPRAGKWACGFTYLWKLYKILIYKVYLIISLLPTYCTRSLRTKITLFLFELQWLTMLQRSRTKSSKNLFFCSSSDSSFWWLIDHDKYRQEHAIWKEWGFLSMFNTEILLQEWRAYCCKSLKLLIDRSQLNSPWWLFRFKKVPSPKVMPPSQDDLYPMIEQHRRVRPTLAIQFRTILKAISVSEFLDEPSLRLC